MEFDNNIMVRLDSFKDKNHPMFNNNGAGVGSGQNDPCYLYDYEEILRNLTKNNISAIGNTMNNSGGSLSIIMSGSKG